MATADYEIKVYNPSTGEQSAFIQAVEWQSLRYTRALNDVGTLQLTIPLTSDKINALLTLDALIEVIRRPDNSSYTVEGTYFARSFNPTIDENDRAWLVIGGLHINHLLWRRIVRPFDDPFQSGGYSTKSGNADDVMTELVDEQMVSSSVADRNFPGLTVAASAGVGDQVGGRWTYEDRILEILQNLALTSGMDFEITRGAGAAMEFAAHEVGSDKTYTTNHPDNPYVIFAPERGNMIMPAISQDRRAELNYLYLLLRGPEDDREIFEQFMATVSDSPFNRIEGTSDARELEEGASVAELQTQGYTWLRDNTIETEFTFAVHNAAISYHTDWDLGDKITARWPAYNEYSQDLRIIGVDVEVNNQGETITPIFRPVIQRALRREGAGPSRLYYPTAGAAMDAIKYTRRDVKRLKNDLARYKGQSQRSEVGGATPRWDSVDDLPDAGKLGRWASVSDDVGGGAGDEGLFWDSGLTWEQIL